jgi:hypothetical protein
MVILSTFSTARWLRYPDGHLLETMLMSLGEHGFGGI